MVLHNKSSSDFFINSFGDSINFVSYSGTSVYDVTTELMTKTKSSGTLNAVIFEPSKNDLFSLAGKISQGSKKFSVNKDSSLSLGDFVIINNVVYELVLMNNFNNRKVFFGNISNKNVDDL